MIDFRRFNENPTWRWSAGAVMGIAALVVVLGIVFPDLAIQQGLRRRRSAAWQRRVTPCGWLWMPAGTGPWGSGPDRGNRGSYFCLKWSSNVESFDTLFSAVYCPTDTHDVALSVKTLLRFGMPGPSETCAARCQILASVYGDSRWVVIRDYGRQDFVGEDNIPLPSSFSHAHRVQFAWVSHVYDTANLRYWCIDDARLVQRKLHGLDMAVAQSLNPSPGQVVPPCSLLSATAMVVNLGSHSESVTVWVLLDSVEVGATHLEIPRRSQVPVEFSVGGKAGNDALLYEHRRHYRPYKSNPDVRLLPGPHTLTFVVQLEFDEEPGNDTLRIPFTVAGDFWQRLPGEYPVPKNTVRRGFAVAGDDLGVIYVRNPGRPGDNGEAFVKLFTTYTLPDGNWRSLSRFEPYLQAVPSERPSLGGACVVDDSFFYCQLNDSGPLMQYDIAANRWSVTSYPTIAARRLEVRCDLAGGVCWDGGDGLYVLGHRSFYRYSIGKDTWSIISWHPGAGGQFGLGDTCGNTGDVAFLNGSLYTIDVDRSLIRYNIEFDCWDASARLPGKGRTQVCRLAADPVGRRVYILTDCGTTGRAQFLAFSPNPDSWILDLPQPEWISQGYTLMPGSALARAGRFLVAAKDGDNQLYMYNLPIPEGRRH